MVDYKRMHAKLKNLIPDVEVFDPTILDYDQWFAVMDRLLLECKSPSEPYRTPIGDRVAWHTYMLAVVWHPSELAEKASGYLTQFHVEFFNLLSSELKRAFSDQQRQLGDEIGEYWLHSTYKKYVLDPAFHLGHVSRMKANDVMDQMDIDPWLWVWAARLMIDTLNRDSAFVNSQLCKYVWSLYPLLRDDVENVQLVPLRAALETTIKNAILNVVIEDLPPATVLSKQRYLELRYWMFEQEQTKLLTRLKLPTEKGLLHDGR